MFKHRVSSDAIDIAAPVERVWDILVDIERYAEWNPLTTRVETDLEIGSPVDLYVTLGPLKLKQPEWIESVDPPHLQRDGAGADSARGGPNTANPLVHCAANQPRFFPRERRSAVRRVPGGLRVPVDRY